MSPTDRHSTRHIQPARRNASPIPMGRGRRLRLNSIAALVTVVGVLVEVRVCWRWSGSPTAPATGSPPRKPRSAVPTRGNNADRAHRPPPRSPPTKPCLRRRTSSTMWPSPSLWAESGLLRGPSGKSWNAHKPSFRNGVDKRVFGCQGRLAPPCATGYAGASVGPVIRPARSGWPVARRPSAAPRRSRASRFWLSFDLAVIRSAEMRKATMPASMVAM